MYTRRPRADPDRCHDTSLRIRTPCGLVSLQTVTGSDVCRLYQTLILPLRDDDTRAPETNPQFPCSGHQYNIPTVLRRISPHGGERARNRLRTIDCSNMPSARTMIGLGLHYEIALMFRYLRRVLVATRIRCSRAGSPIAFGVVHLTSVR